MKQTVYYLITIIILFALLIIGLSINFISINYENEEFINFRINSIVNDKNTRVDEVIRIDNDNFVIVYKKSNLINEKENSYYESKTYIHKYNLKDGLIGKEVYLSDINCSFTGLDIYDSMLYFIGVDYSNLDNDNKYLTYKYNVNYNTMNIESVNENIGYKYNIQISKDMNYWIYNTDKGLYISEKNFENSKLLVPLIKNKDMFLNTKASMIKNDRIIYSRFEADNIYGLGIIGFEGNNDSYFDIPNANYLGLDEEKYEMYYANLNDQNNIMKVSTLTFEKNEAFKVDNIDVEKIHYTSYMSEDTKYLLLIKEDSTVEGNIQVEMSIYDFGSKEVINTHRLESNSLVNSARFVNNSIIFIQNDKKIVIWNFNN